MNENTERTESLYIQEKQECNKNEIYLKGKKFLKLFLIEIILSKYIKIFNIQILDSIPFRYDININRESLYFDQNINGIEIDDFLKFDNKNASLFFNQVPDKNIEDAINKNNKVQNKLQDFESKRIDDNENKNILKNDVLYKIKDEQKISEKLTPNQNFRSTICDFQHEIRKDNDKSHNINILVNENDISEFMWHKKPSKNGFNLNPRNEIIKQSQETNIKNEILFNKDPLENHLNLKNDLYNSTSNNPTIKTHKRNNTVFGDLLMIQNKLNNIDKNNKIKENSNNIEINNNKLNILSVKQDENNISKKSDDLKILINSEKKSPLMRKINTRKLNLSNIGEMFPNIDLPASTSNKKKNLQNQVTKKDHISLSNFLDFKKNDINSKKIDKIQNKKNSQINPSSIKNLLNKETNNNKIPINSPFETKQDLMKDYPLMNNVFTKKSSKDIKDGEITSNEVKNIQETTLDFNSNNFDFINVESSINAELLDNIQKKNHLDLDDEINKEINNQQNIQNQNSSIENCCSIETLNKYDIKLNATENMLDHSIDRYSIFNLKKYNILILGGKSKTSDFSTFKYDFEQNRWKKIEEVKVSRTDFCAVSLDTKNILILGGRLFSLNQKENITDTIELLNIQNMKKSKLNIKLKQPKCNFGSIILEKENEKSSQIKIKVMFIGGGYNGMDVLNYFEFYDFTLEKWFELPNMPIKRKEFGMILDNYGMIYFIGGVDDRE